MNFLFAIMILLATPHAKAENLAKEVAEVFAITFTQTVTQEALKEGVNAVAAETINVSGVGTAALAAYGFYNAATDFADAETDSARYYAATQATAAAVGYFNPAIGLIIGLANVGQQLLGNLVTLDDQKALAKTVSEIRQIQERIQQINESMIRSDVAYFQELYSQHQRTLLQIIAYSNYLSKMCPLVLGQESDTQALKCLEVMTQIHYAKRFLILISDQLLAHRGDLLTFERFLAHVAPQASFVEFKAAISKLRAVVATEGPWLSRIRKQISESFVREFLAQTAQNGGLRKAQLCLLGLQRSVNELNRLELLIQNESLALTSRERAWEEFAVLHVQAKRIWNDGCTGVNLQDSERFQRSLQQLLAVLERKNPALYLDLIEELP